MTSPMKPLILIGCTPIYGHFMPIRAIAKDLISRGYEVTFLASPPFKKYLDSIGASYAPIEGYAAFSENFNDDIASKWPERNTLPPGPAQLLFDTEHCFIQTIPSQHESFQKALKKLKETHPGRPIININEGLFLGHIPTRYGAPGYQADAVINIGILPMALLSDDAAPFGPGLLPDPSPAGRERNKAMNKGLKEEVMAGPQKAFEEELNKLGAKNGGKFFIEAAFFSPDRFLQMCTPSVEYPRSDAPAHIRFVGGLPKGHRDPFTNAPSWWSEVTDNKTKKIVAVSQGSVALNYEELIIPTMTAFASNPDILVVVALGAKGAALPAGTAVPENARVADFIPFDELLPHCAVFVTNCGYGAFQHAIGNGTPLVAAGISEDKFEVAARAEWAGVAINLRTQTPTVEQVRESVEEVLANPKYKARATELEKEMASFDPMGIVANTIEELAKEKAVANA
ncbi:putative UDP-glucuronosyltransferase 2A3 [Bisporella sp. PMI_857]|nr:putative UDP-glucuronosyltransferase 2A3 [Bisporella sp. PMI_857]